MTSSHRCSAAVELRGRRVSAWRAADAKRQSTGKKMIVITSPWPSPGRRGYDLSEGRGESMIRLYDYLPSGNGYKVRLLLTQLSIPFERIELDIIKGETRTQNFLAKFPNGRIPAI